MKLSDLLALPVGTKLPAIEATTKQCKTPQLKQGNSQNGKPYSFWSQSVLVTDGETDVWASFGWDNEHDALTTAPMKVVFSAAVDEWQGKRNLKKCKLIPTAATLPQPQREAQPAPKSDGREICIIRQNALAHATALLIASTPRATLEQWDANQLAGNTIAIAERLAEWAATGKVVDAPTGSGLPF